ncbi:MAG: polysaccharide pyruvyl transferase family protein [Acidithiobacillus sp.]|jgi:hypothetical protein|uniref:polysaccharide pyruvyl transferase family protein n=1 Tax=Acidithiobacillus sp. TaxID=1872118 RepID=UPI00355DF619
MKNILYYGGCWPQNIGNAFIDIGAKYILKTIFPDSNIHFASETPRWYMSRENRINDAIDIAEISDADILVYSGMCLCEDFIEKLSKSIISHKKRGKEFIILGGGGLYYNNVEIESYKRFLTKYKPLAFISRDDTAFSIYKNIAKYDFNGIDCGLFLNQAFCPLKLNIEKYIVTNFDHNKEIKIDNLDNYKIISSTHSLFYKLYDLSLIKNLMISDIPDDYLNLYANANKIYTDRVHTAVAAISFNVPVQLFSTSIRNKLFNKIDAFNITKEMFLQLNNDLLILQQNNEISFLKSIL